MGIRERLSRDKTPEPEGPKRGQRKTQKPENLGDPLQQLKERIHRRLIDKLDLTRLASISRDELRALVR
ncbi:MAG: hypothetical protein PVH52_07755, partial [bacterium]